MTPMPLGLTSRIDGLVYVKAKLVPKRQIFGGALFTLAAAAYVEEGFQNNFINVGNGAYQLLNT